MKVCALCGKEAECEHHLIFGTSKRKLAEADGLKILCCNECHNMAVKAVDRIHGNSTAEKLSKMLGQAIWEKNFIMENCNIDPCMEAIARAEFIQRYGRSYQ